MALIYCPECQKEISDQVTNCPHCGYPLAEKEDIQKVEVSSIKMSINQEKWKKFLIGVLITISLIIGIFGGYKIYDNYQTEKANELYISDVESLATYMINSGSEAEDLLILTYKVWYNSIHEESDVETDPYTKYEGTFIFYDDFNDALTALASDETIQTQKNTLETDQTFVAQKVKDLQNPPSEYENIYEVVLELYSSYQNITDLAINPTGSLNSFSETKRNEIDSFIELYDKLQILLPTTD